jgi:hypothetical protein
MAELVGQSEPPGSKLADGVPIMVLFGGQGTGQGLDKVHHPTDSAKECKNWPRPWHWFQAES